MLSHRLNRYTFMTPSNTLTAAILELENRVRDMSEVSNEKPVNSGQCQLASSSRHRVTVPAPAPLYSVSLNTSDSLYHAVQRTPGPTHLIISPRSEPGGVRLL